jgi:hypothetical protein
VRLIGAVLGIGGKQRDVQKPAVRKMKALSSHSRKSKASICAALQYEICHYRNWNWPPGRILVVETD